MKRKAFDVNIALVEAWNEIWEGKKTLRDNPSGWRGSEGFYITRQELIRKVRAYAYADLKGQPRKGADYDYGVRLNFNLDGAVCDWLSRGERTGKLQSHSFGRNTITGRRYRPAGEPISPTEEKTLKAKAERKPWAERTVHWRNGDGYSWRMACRTTKRATWRVARSTARLSSKKEEVTCPRCLKLLKEGSPKEAA